MNRGCLTIQFLLALSVLATGLILPPDGSTAPPSGSGVTCYAQSSSSGAHVSLLQYYGWLRSATIDETTKQYGCARFSAEKGAPRAKLVLALLLTLPDTPFADHKRAKVLLDAFMSTANEQDAEDQSLAVLMLALLDEVTRLEAQLEQLKSIEQDITETEQSVNVPAPAPALQPDLEPEPEREPEIDNEREEKDTAGR